MSPSRANPLLSRRTLAVIGVAASLGLGSLYEVTRRRAQLARTESPSSLSLQYLRLALNEQPDNREARLALVQAAIKVGELDEAREVLAPLLRPAAGSSAPDANMLALSMELERLAFTSLAEPAARAAARARYVGQLQLAHRRVRTPDARMELAQRARTVGENALWVRLLQERVTLDGALDEASLAQAEAALLENGQPLAAAQLYEHAALRSAPEQGLSHARKSLELARSAAAPSEASALFTRLKPRFAADPELLRLGLSIADDASDRPGAMALAEALLKLEPERPEAHEEVMRRAAWAGHSTRVLHEQMWLAVRTNSAAYRHSAVETARALSDLRAELALRGPAKTPLSRRELIDRMALHEALGDGRAAHALLADSLAREHAGDEWLWSHRVALELAAGDHAAAVDSLASMDQRFGVVPARITRRADLLLRMGRAREAGQLLEAHSDAQDYSSLTRLAELAWQVADSELATRSYRRVTQHPLASGSDYARLYALLRMSGEQAAATQLAMGGLARFGTHEMLELALNAALDGNDAALIAPLLERSEQDPQLAQHVRYVVLRASFRQQLAQRARVAGDFTRASEQLARARTDLMRPLVSPSPSLTRQLAALRRAQWREELGLALDTHDKPWIARIYPHVAASLAPQEKVVVLHALERDEQALHVALEALSSRSADSPSSLARDADQLARDLPRRASFDTGFSDLGPLRLWELRAGLVYGWSRRGWLASIEYSKLDPDGPDALTLTRTHELRAQLGGFLRRGRHLASAELGVDTRDGGSPQPFLLLRDALAFDQGARLALHGALNEVATDSAELRASALRDQLNATASLPLHARLSATLGAALQLWSDRDRNLLGAGVTAEGALIYHLLPRDGALRLDVRALARSAPRFDLDDQPEQRVPDTSHWFGGGASLAYGDIALPPVFGRRVSVLADGALGWLVPQAELGFYAEAGVAVSPFGSDALALKGRASNVIGNGPGSFAYGVGLSYTRSLW